MPCLFKPNVSKRHQCGSRVMASVHVLAHFLSDGCGMCDLALAVYPFKARPGKCQKPLGSLCALTNRLPATVFCHCVRHVFQRWALLEHLLCCLVAGTSPEWRPLASCHVLVRTKPLTRASCSLTSKRLPDTDQILASPGWQGQLEGAALSSPASRGFLKPRGSSTCWSGPI